MSIFGSLVMKSMSGAAWTAGKALGGPLRRVGVGTVAGGIYGGATSDFNTPEGMAGDIFRGAAVGGMIGVGTTAAAWKTAGRSLWASRHAAGPVARAGWGAGKMTARAAGGAIRAAPNLIGGTAAVAASYGIFMGGGADPVRSAMADQVRPMINGPAPEDLEFRSSTNGVVQGLHSSRHGGW
jgi:hypothetical protein